MSSELSIFPTVDVDLVRRTHCPVCAGPHQPETVVDDLQYVRCTGCGLTFMDPMPTQGWYDELYESDYWKTRIQEVDDERETRRRLRKEHLRAVSYLRALQAESALPRDGVLLEVGCGTGGAAATLAHELGWTAFGIEPDFASREVAASLGVHSEEASLASLAEQGREFDLVLLSHVLEHVVDPRGFLEQVLRVLSRNGVLVIEVPNGFTNESLHLFHPYLFTRRALMTLFSHHQLRGTIRSHGGAASWMRHHYLLAIVRRADEAPVRGTLHGRSLGRFWARAWKRSRVLGRIDRALASRKVRADEKLLARWFAAF